MTPTERTEHRLQAQIKEEELRADVLFWGCTIGIGIIGLAILVHGIPL